MDLVELLKHPEGKTLERERQHCAADGVLKPLVACANTAGGTLLLGGEDRSGPVRGVAEPLDMQERLASPSRDRISPRLLPEIEILPWRRAQVLATPVHPSPSRPHHLTREGAEIGAVRRRERSNLPPGPCAKR